MTFKDIATSVDKNLYELAVIVICRGVESDQNSTLLMRGPISISKPSFDIYEDVYEQGNFYLHLNGTNFAPAVTCVLTYDGVVTSTPILAYHSQEYITCTLAFSFDDIDVKEGLLHLELINP